MFAWELKTLEFWVQSFQVKVDLNIWGILLYICVKDEPYLQKKLSFSLLAYSEGFKNP